MSNSSKRISIEERIGNVDMAIEDLQQVRERLEIELALEKQSEDAQEIAEFLASEEGASVIERLNKEETLMEELREIYSS